MSTPVPDPRDRGPRLALDVALIVAVGVALGLAYNHSMLLANDARALSWTVKPRSTGVLDLATPAPTAAPAGDAASAPASASSSSATTGTTPETSPSATGAPHDSAAHAAPVKNTGKPAGSAKKSAPKGATTKPASTSASPAHGPIPTDETAAKPAAPAPATTAAAVPVIPDTREPLEASYAVIKALHDANAALFVDARTAEEYAAGHIPGAVSLPFDDVFKKPDLAKQLDSQGRPIVTYCDGVDCELSKDLAFSLIDNGHKKVVFFKDGLPGWKSAGNEVHTGAQP